MRKAKTPVRVPDFIVLSLYPRTPGVKKQPQHSKQRVVETPQISTLLTKYNEWWLTRSNAQQTGYPRARKTTKRLRYK